MRLTFIVLTTLILLSSCDDKYIADSKTYVGTYRVTDQLIPYPYLIHQKKDTLYLFNNIGQLIDKTENEVIKSNTELKFKDKQFKILDFNQNSFSAFDVLDTINFKTYEDAYPIKKYSAYFENVSATKTLDIENIEKEIKNTIWEYNLIADENTNPNNDLEIEQLLYFKSDSLHIISNYYYQGLKTISEQETKAYKIFNIENIYFLSFIKKNDNPQPIYQIIGYDSGKIELKDFSSLIIKDISFHRSSMNEDHYNELINKTSYYSNCFDGFQGEYYYGDEVTHNKGNNHLIKYVNANAPKNDSNSGYIIVHFNINCHSKVGRFGLIQMDRAYKPTSFSKEMVHHIINKVSLLKDFPSSYSQMEWLAYKDVHAFLMFKLENGKIIDLCP